MAGIYLHIPFCRQACHYCNFHFSTSLNRTNDFVVALLKEMELRKSYIGGEMAETVYFGGGTPSLLQPEELGRIMEGLRTQFDIGPGAEITLEANPDDITLPQLKSWKAAGINRLSIGVQSFFGEDLQWMNRAHGPEQALAAIRIAQGEGFANISADLIYGGPTLPDSHWKKNVEQAIALGIPHLSCYALTVEPKTALDKMIHLKKVQAVDPEDQARQFLLLMEWLGNAGYEHYEISNFAMPGRRSRHNSSYWQGRRYLGLGPSAHSFDGLSRQWNIANNARYTEALSEGRLLFEREELLPVQQLNEYIMTSLRTVEGCDLSYVSLRWGKEAASALLGKTGPFVNGGTMDGENGRLVLTREGKLLTDGITAELFFENLSLPVA
ncbi:MAG TPA: radical SAM family heme chaperone HemW [Puia sp.]|nr:radical SAM family heme chaperone HemW [Puia sp.]